MTTLAAGSMGASWEPGHPGKLAVYNDLEIDYSRILFVEQKHTRRVERAEELGKALKGQLREADGIITQNPDDVLCVTAADCMPVFLYDSTEGVRALLHSGWKGTGIALQAVKKMRKEYGCKPCNIEAVLGPAIESCCYNVEQARAEEFEAKWGIGSISLRDGQHYLSLREANRGMLESAGVGVIKSIDECTCCSRRLGSYRREGADFFTLMMVLSTI